MLNPKSLWLVTLLLLPANLLAEESNTPLTLKQIMADPDWIGNSPESMYWAEDSQAIFYDKKRVGSSLRDRFQIALSENSAEMLSPEQLAAASVASFDKSPNGELITYSYAGNIFIKSLMDRSLRQVTQDSASQSEPRFLNDQSIIYREANSFIQFDLNTGMRSLVVEVKLEDDPDKRKSPSNFYTEQQERYFEYIRDQKREESLRKENEQRLQRQDPTRAPRPVYVGKGNELENLSLSPDAKHLVIVTSKERKRKNDKMPRFVTDDGYVGVQNVREKVGTPVPYEEQIHLYSLETQTLKAVSLDNLPDIRTNRLYEVDREVAKESDDKRKISRTLDENRPVYVATRRHYGIDWNDAGSQVAMLLWAYDNKDRWLVTMDVNKASLSLVHQQYDPAWINPYTFNQYGWIDDERLYYLSESSGYSHLYVHELELRTRQITRGSFEVANVTLSNDKAHAYFSSNREHPGHYDIYRVPVRGGDIERLTELGGLTEYQLSPDNRRLLLRHSTMLQPPELYVQKVEDKSSIRRLTDSTTDAFKAISWQKPEIIQIPSSHSDQPIYARVYRPTSEKGKEADKYPAVVFTHGAGYLQNAHGGWSGYFREFMFHNLLAQQGYVVLDPDYRASRGYGRDWRTAIYRRMGTPEVEDLRDGVKYLVDNYQVDGARVGTYGGSYGGFLTFMALFTAPDLFQAGAALRPVTDWAHYNHGYTSNILNTPERDPIAYRRSSPIEFAEGLEKPLLIAHGMVDSNVVFQDSVRLVQRLIELEKENFETAIYPIEGHGFRTASSWLDEYRRIYKLFEEHVK